MKNKTLILILLVIVIIVSAGSGIYMYNKEHNVEGIKQEMKELVKENVSIEIFKEALEENDIKIENEIENQNCELIGAKEGMTYTISGKDIWIYRFDLNTSDEIAVENLKKVQEENKIIIPSLDNVELSAIYNKGLIILNLEDHPESEKIKEIFINL